MNRIILSLNNKIAIIESDYYYLSIYVYIAYT
jgi:hypothetical protein